MKLPLINEVIVKSIIKDLTILHLSDLHINKKTSEKSVEELVSLCNKIDADFIVITGDIIDCKAKFIKKKLELLNNIEKQTFYISGNHDLFYGFKDLKNILSKLTCLDNETTTIKIKDKTIAIAGLSDRFSKFFGIKREEKKLQIF